VRHSRNLAFLADPLRALPGADCGADGPFAEEAEDASGTGTSGRAGTRDRAGGSSRVEAHDTLPKNPGQNPAAEVQALLPEAAAADTREDSMTAILGCLGRGSGFLVLLALAAGTAMRWAGMLAMGMLLKQMASTPTSTLPTRFPPSTGSFRVQARFALAIQCAWALRCGHFCWKCDGLATYQAARAGGVLHHQY